MSPEADASLPLHPAVEKVRSIERELRSFLIAREAEIRGSLLALIARQHLFLLSPPGTGKSLLSSEVCRRIRGDADRFFKIELNAFTLRDELFGPISLRAMRDEDALRRKTEGFLPSASVAQLDEIWKAPPALLNTLLTILNEREFRNDDAVLRAPLISAFVTSNETPPADSSLDALYDRILLRYSVAPLSTAEQRRAAARFSLKMRAFEAHARAVAERLRTERAKALAAHERELRAQLAEIERRVVAAGERLAAAREADERIIILTTRAVTLARRSLDSAPAEQKAELDAEISSGEEKIVAARGHLADAERRAREAQAGLEAEQARVDAAIEIARAESAADGLSMARPDRWLIDTFGELFSNPTLRADVDPDGLTSTADDAALLREMLTYATDYQLELPYQTFITRSDLDTLHQLALQVSVPEKVEEALYAVLDEFGGVTSVRRETELRTLIAAQAVLEGRSVVSITDLEIMVHALWNTPNEISTARKAVEKVTGSVERELKLLIETIESWRNEDDPDVITDKMAKRRQMDQEIERLESLAEVHPEDDRIADVLSEARAERDAFNARMVAGPDSDEADHPALEE